MNLARARKALLAVARREHRHLEIRRPANDADVREMVEEGLVEATLSDASRNSPTVVRRLTDAGRRFLGIFPAGYRFCRGG